jgi:membrane-associated phospholipid phosphatase
MRILSRVCLIGYFVYTAVLAFALPMQRPVTELTVGVNAAIIGSLVLLAYAQGLRQRPVLTVLQDWAPLALLLFAYRQMGWFEPVRHLYQLARLFAGWDHALLQSWGLKALIEAAGPLAPAVLEMAYSAVYLMPVFSLAAVYAFGKRDEVERLLLPLALGVLVVCALFPWFPSEPPRTIFPGQDLPAWDTVFRRFNLWLVDRYGIHTGVFPSVHVTTAFCCAFAMRRLLPRPRWIGALLLTLSILIAVATVYGRYHYAVDAVAGFVASAIAQALAELRFRRGLGAGGRL